MEEQQKTNEEMYPSVLFAYELSIKSYDWVSKRLELMEDRIDKLVTLMTGINLAVISLSFKDVSHFNCFFYYVIGAYILGTIIALMTRHTGHIKIISPTILFNQWLHYSEWEFKKNAIYKAGEDYDQMSKSLSKKNKWFIITSIVYAIEVILLMFWIIPHF